MTFPIRRLLVLVVFPLALVAGNDHATSPFRPEFVRQADATLSASYRAHPFVAQPAPAAVPLGEGELVRLQDLRGVECYAQPDQLNVCGTGDTIPILLFTKSTTPIEDIGLTVQFDDGLEYAGFAFAAFGPAELSVDNADNLQSPAFSISEVSQDGGGVVVYVGVRASCGIDLDVLNPSITFLLDYTTPQGDCSDAITPPDPYGSNVAVPEVVFNAEPSPTTISLADRGAVGCTTIPITQVTTGAGALGATLAVTDYGFGEGVSLSSVTVGGVPVPPAAIMTDDAGDVTINLDGEQQPGYFGGDGALDFGEDAPVELCFVADTCFVDANPTLSVVFACRGERCGGTPDFETDLVIENVFDFNVDWQVTDVAVLQEPSACGTDGDPDNLVIAYSFSNPVGDYRADLTGLRFIVDRCTLLDLDTIYLAGDNPGGLPLALAGVVRDITSSNLGRAIINLSNSTNPAALVTDPDGPGVGLADLDGDGLFDDLPGDQSLRIVFEFSPAAGGGDLTCAGGFDVCDFSAVRVVGRRDCSTEDRAYAAAIPGQNMFAVASDAGIGGDTATFVTSQTPFPGGLNFGVVGRTSAMPGPPNISSSKDIEFRYELDPADGIACSTVGDRQVIIEYATVLKGATVDMELDMLSGGTLVSNELSQPDSLVRRWVIDVPDNVDMNQVDFRLTQDTNLCVTVITGTLSAFVVDNCGGCADARVIRTCDSAPTAVDPDNFPECVCDYESDIVARRVTTGFTDRGLSDRLTTEETADRAEVMDGTISADIDTLQVMPGDTVEFAIDYLVTNAPDWNNRDFIAFNLFQITTNSTTQRNELTHIFEAHLARLQSIELLRPGQADLDLGTVTPGGKNFNLVAGISFGSGNAAGLQTAAEVPQPGLSHDDYVFNQGTLRGDVRNDGNGVALRFRNSFDGADFDAADALYAAIGGGFQNDDTIRMVLQIPIMSVPDELAGGVPLNPVTDVSRLLATAEGRDYNGNGSLTTNILGATSICTERPVMQFYAPEPKVEAVLDYATGTGADPAFASCDATLTIDYTIDNPPPPGFYPNEYRPILGVEDFTAAIPASYYYVPGTATITVLNGGLTDTIDFATTTGNSITLPDGRTVIVADPDPVTLSFVDAERADGTNWPNYDAADDGMRDVSLSGGSAPRLGVGLSQMDTLRVTVPLRRLCPANPATGFTLTTMASYPSVPDYNTQMYVCNDGVWYPAATECPPGVVRYFPYDRDSPDNPHRYTRDIIISTTNAPASAPVPTVAVDQPFLLDLMGSETNTYTLTTPTAVPGGVVAIEVSNAVDLIAVSGDASVFNLVATGDTSVVYSVEVPALAANETFTLDLETELVLCNRADIRLSAVLGCTDDERAAVLASFAGGCGANVAYFYISGQADLVTTFDYPSQQNGCGVADYTIQYRNTGTSDLEAFQPIVFVPEGIDLIPGSFTVRTLSPGAGPSAIVDPTENTDTTGVFGRGFVWPTAYFENAAFGTDRIEEGEIVLLSFRAQPTCDFISGRPLASRVNVSAACERALGTDPATGPPVNLVQVPDPTAPAFTFQLSDNRISCAPGQEPLVLTALNTGKGNADATDLCFVLPPGLTLTPGNIRAVAPVGYQPENVTVSPVGTGGATEVCFAGPTDISPGGFFCLEIDLEVGEVPCGPITIGAQLTRTATINCAGITCDVQVLASDGLLELEVVPPLDIVSAELAAACSDAPGSTDLTFDLELETIGSFFLDQVTFDVIFDADGNGEINSGEPVISTQSRTINVFGDTTLALTLVATVPENQACPVILRATLPGCACNELLFPFDPVEPLFLADLGDNLVLCPGDSAAIGPVCGTFDLAVEPAVAGSAVQRGEFVIVTLNPGFGEDAPVTLRATNEIGTCGAQEFTVSISALADFSFDSYAVTACSQGCTAVDLMIPSNLREDLTVSFSPALYLDDDAPDLRPRICDPATDVDYTLRFSLNEDSCVTTTTLDLTVVAPPTLTISPAATCRTGGTPGDFVTVSDPDLDATLTVRGDGTFVGSTVPPSQNPDFTFPQARLSDDAVYVPGPEDLRAGSYTVTVRTDDPAGPCGGVRATATFEILLVDCGNFFWNGGED